jgi:hypothetical protein
VYGENDPWSAEKFEPGAGTRDSYWFTVPAGNHYAAIAGLPTAARAAATKILQTWLGVPVDTTIRASVQREPLGHSLPGLMDPGLDRAQRDIELVGDLGVRERAEVP